MIEACHLPQSSHRRWQLSLTGSDFQTRSGISSHLWNLPLTNLLDFGLWNPCSFSFPNCLFSSPASFPSDVLAGELGGFFLLLPFWLTSGEMFVLGHTILKSWFKIPRKRDFLSFCVRKELLRGLVTVSELTPDRLTLSDSENDNASWTLDHKCSQPPRACRILMHFFSVEQHNVP